MDIPILFFTIECRRVLKRGLNDANVDMTNMRIVLMGPPCVGKTAFKSLLFNWPAPKAHDSTALATRPIRAIERVAELKEGKIWITITGFELLKMLTDAIRAFDDESEFPKDPIDGILLPKSVASTQPTTGAVPRKMVIEEPDLSSNFHMSPVIIPPHNSILPGEEDPQIVPENSAVVFHASTGIPPCEETDILSNISSITDDPDPESDKLSQSTSSVTNTQMKPSQKRSRFKPQPDADYSKDVLRLLAERNKSDDLHKSTWIHILDSGGQPQFADISCAFLRGNTINIICTKLTESLSDKPQFCYSINGKLLNQPSELQMTNIELINILCDQ